MLLETWCAAVPLVEEEGAHDSIDTTSGDVVVQKRCDLKKVTADAECCKIADSKRRRRTK